MVVKETEGKILKSTYIGKLRKISAGLSVEYHKKRRVSGWLLGFFSWTNGRIICHYRDKKDSQGKDFGNGWKEFSLEPVMCKLCIKHSSGGVNLSWIWVWWFEKSLCYWHKFGYYWHMCGI